MSGARRGVPPLVVTGLIAVATTGLVISGVLAGIAIAQPGRQLDAATVALIGTLAGPALTATGGLCSILASTRSTTEAAAGSVTVTPSSTSPSAGGGGGGGVTILDAGVTVAPTAAPASSPRRTPPAKKAAPRKRAPRRPKP